MDLFIGIFVGFVLSFFWWRHQIIKAVERAIDQTTDDATQSNIKLRVTVEQEGDQFLLYNTDTNQFVMQGTTIADFQKRLLALQVDAFTIENGSSVAAQALLKVSQRESNEISNNK